jgi:hypothetical protein
MEKFAVVMTPDSGQRIVDGHPVLKRLPKKIALACLPYLSAQKTGIIMDNDYHAELGCLIDVPGFFSGWDELDDEGRYKTINGIVRLLNRLKTRILCFPLCHRYLRAEEINLLEDCGILMLDGFHHRLAGMLLAWKQLLVIMKNDIPRFSIGVWGADNDTGRIWTEALAGNVNDMCIGGLEYRDLEQLADTVLKTTGLACQVTNKPEICLGSKNIVIIAEPVSIPVSKCRPLLQFHSVRDHYYFEDYYSVTAADIQNTYYIEMGWMASPKDLDIAYELDPWEELGVLEGLFYAVSRVYREDIINSRITLAQMKRIHTLYEMYPVKLQGLVHSGRRIHFERFRREYFSSLRSRIIFLDK